MTRKLWVRLKPYNRRTGHKLRSISFMQFGNASFNIKKGWVTLTNPNPDLVRTLQEFRNPPGDHLSPLAFDVCSYEEAKEIEDREREIAQRMAQVPSSVDKANTLSTRDLPSTRATRAEIAEENRRRARAAGKAATTREAEAQGRSAALDAEERSRLEAKRRGAEDELAKMDAEDEASVSDTSTDLDDADLDDIDSETAVDEAVGSSEATA